MLNGQLKHDLALPTDNGSAQGFINSQVDSLLNNLTCDLPVIEDYAFEAGAAAVNGLTGTNETADTALYAAIERKDWAEVDRIYREVFRPHLLAFAVEQVEKATEKQAA